jgi:hypothetical protein
MRHPFSAPRSTHTTTTDPKTYDHGFRRIEQRPKGRLSAADAIDAIDAERVRR